MSGEAGSDDWCTIESDPGVFTALLEDLGVTGVELQELWSLDDESLGELIGGTGGKVYGLIFLFQWNDKDPAASIERTPLPESEIPPNLFFAHQVTTNACATQAILSVLFNASDLSAEQKGTTLSEFQSFTQEFPPSLKGVAISSSEEIKKCHNSFSRQDAFLSEGKFHIPTGKEEAFHFVAYVPCDGTVYELDGLQKGPIVVGQIPDSGEDGSSDSLIPAWLTVTRQAIQDRMTLFQSAGDEEVQGIKFNLMAVIQDKRIAAAGDDAALAQEEEKRVHWKLENQRRRHNYVPLCMQILKELALLGTLPQLTQEAQERQAGRRANSKKVTIQG